MYKKGDGALPGNVDCFMVISCSYEDCRGTMFRSAYKASVTRMQEIKRTYKDSIASWTLVKCALGSSCETKIVPGAQPVNGAAVFLS